MAYKVLIPQDVAQEGKDYLLENGYEIKMGSGMAEADVVRDVQDCDAILLRTAPVTRKVLEAGNKLQIVARHGAGYDNVDLQAAAELGIWATNAPLSTTNSVAECTIGLMLVLAKQYVPLAKSMREGNFFYKNGHKGIDLEGKTLGLVGLGRIGQSVAQKAMHGFGMKVIAYDPHLPSNLVPEGVAMSNWETVFRTADFVSLHMPKTPETIGMIGRAEFSMMKQTAYFINCARGEVVREEEMTEALRKKEIAGAALDVLDKEPPAIKNPLFQLDNVVLTPHIGSNTEECMARMALHAAMEIHRVLSGEAPQWPVNKPVAKAI